MLMATDEAPSNKTAGKVQIIKPFTEVCKQDLCWLFIPGEKNSLFYPLLQESFFKIDDQNKNPKK